MLPRPAVAAVARVLLAAAPLALLSGGCATNPATGKPQLSFFGEEAELAMGKEADGEIVATVGIYDDDELADYVDEVGHRLAATSERPYLPWSFKVLDDPTVNAFALPGGYVYVTRGILAELDSEAELAAVLGHEIGHVTARHSVHRQSQQLLAAAGVITAAVVLDADHADEWADLGMLGLGLAFLSYSRADERQADDLGLRYLLRAGYDPQEMPGVFEMLEQVGKAESGGGQMPAWLSTHPDPGKRRLRISEEVTAVQARGEAPTDPRVEREAYLHHLDGLAYGPDPSLGALRDGEAVHPALGFRLQAPAGWNVTGNPKGLTLRPAKGGAAIVVETSEEGSASSAETKFFAEAGVAQGDQWRSHGVRWSRFTAAQKDGDLAGTVGFVERDDTVFQILGLASAASWSGVRDTVEDAMASFDDANGLDAVDGRRLEVVTLPEAMGLTAFAERWPSTVGLPDLALLNRVATDGTLEAGRLAKRVVGGGGGPGDGRKRTSGKAG
jgi:predicted Zn-dependent protease